MTSGTISLQRKDTEFSGGYGILKQELPELLQDISMLHPEEKKYLNTLKFNRRKHSYLLGRVASKQALSQLITTQKPGAVFVDSGIFQFPVAKYIHNLNIQVTISHCEHIGLALAFPEAHPLGIDIEKIEENKIDTIKSQMTSKEKTMIPAMEIPLNSAYTMLWTIKESLSKILKTGLMTNFKFFEVDSLLPDGNSYAAVFVHHGQYKAISRLLGSYSCTLVFPKYTTPNLDRFWSSLQQVIHPS